MFLERWQATSKRFERQLLTITQTKETCRGLWLCICIDGQYFQTVLFYQLRIGMCWSFYRGGLTFLFQTSRGIILTWSESWVLLYHHCYVQYVTLKHVLLTKLIISYIFRETKKLLEHRHEISIEAEKIVAVYNSQSVPLKDINKLNVEHQRNN